jgi:hypothetical protein
LGKHITAVTGVDMPTDVTQDIDQTRSINWDDADW